MKSSSSVLSAAFTRKGWFSSMQNWLYGQPWSEKFRELKSGWSSLKHGIQGFRQISKTSSFLTFFSNSLILQKRGRGTLIFKGQTRYFSVPHPLSRQWTVNETLSDEASYSRRKVFQGLGSACLRCSYFVPLHSIFYIEFFIWKSRIRDFYCSRSSGSRIFQIPAAAPAGCYWSVLRCRPTSSTSLHASSIEVESRMLGIRPSFA